MVGVGIEHVSEGTAEGGGEAKDEDEADVEREESEVDTLRVGGVVMMGAAAKEVEEEVVVIKCCCCWWNRCCSCWICFWNIWF